jgi:acetoin utilization deacetylase AcuC-like enzyme
MRPIELRRWLAWDRQLPVWYDPNYRLPLTAFGKRTGLDPRRADLVAWYLLDRGWLGRENFRTPARVRYDALARVHTPEYLESLSDRNTLARVFGVDPWDVPVDELLNSARLVCGGTIAAARAAIDRGGPAVNLSGGFHHAGVNWGAGLCPVNDVAVAVAVLRHEGFDGQVAVLDLDAHPPDGTASCLRNDPLAWIGSLSGSSSGTIPGADETVLPPRCGDEEYLGALAVLLKRMPRPALALVIAGGDVLDDDHLGRLGLSLDGARRRDLKVAEALRGIPSVWLPGGGYHDRAWRVLAGTVLALSHRTSHEISPGNDPLAARYLRLARYLRSGPLRQVPELSFEDVEIELGIKSSSQRRVLLDTYTLEALEYALFRFGVLSFVERRGYRNLRISFSIASSGGEQVTITGEADGETHVLVECVLERQLIADRPTLHVNWLSLRDPKARFSERRPRLPGQDVPGLGLARELTEMLMLAAQRLQLDGVGFSPAWYHTAYVAKRRFRFIDAAHHGRFLALVAAFPSMRVDDLSHAIADGRVRLNGEPYAWEPAPMTSWATHEGPQAGELARAREGAHFTLE